MGCVVAGLAAADWLILVLPLLLRAALLVATAVHEMGHAFLAGGELRKKLNDCLSAIPLTGLIPFFPIYIPGISHSAYVPGVSLQGLTANRKRCCALTGLGANGLVLCALIPATEHLSMPFGVADAFLFACIGAHLLILLSSWTDFKTCVTGEGASVYCGNFGILAKRGPRERGFLPRRFLNIVEQLGKDTDIRGRQAGGLAVLASGGHFIGRKVLNEKRGDLTQNLLRAFSRSALFSRMRGIKPLHEIVHLVAHYRYATSGGASVVETHWHRWLPERSAWVWRVEAAGLVRRRQKVANLITHNGDFDAWNAPWGRLDHHRLGRWLAEVLGFPCRAKGDSSRIAGMMDLLVTEGQWEASLRLAYALETGHAMPSLHAKSLVNALEREFKRWADSSQEPSSERGFVVSVLGCATLGDVCRTNQIAIERLHIMLHQAVLAHSRDWPDSVKKSRPQIVASAIEAFFNNDLFKAAQVFMAGAEGTFGLVTTSSLYAGTVVLCADRQPLFVGADPENEIYVYASESAALKNMRCRGADKASGPLPYRYDLEDGDIVRLTVNPGSSESVMTKASRGSAPVTERMTLPLLEASAHDRGRHGWISLRSNDYVEARPAENKPERHADRVLDEMSDIPRVLEGVRREWALAGSLNRQTADAFSRFFFANVCGDHLCSHAHRGPQMNIDPDLLVIGIENNLAIGQRFVADLKRVFPYLNAQAIDAVSFCENPERYELGPGTMTLAISHSGQTFNTLDAVKFLVALNRLGKAGPVFVMTGEVDSLMGAAVAQGIKADAPWAERVFVNGAGWRTAEPATVTTAATHATLTQLLMCLMRDGKTYCVSDCRPFGMRVRDEEINRLDEMTRLSIARSAAIFGRTAEGWDVESPERARLLKEGRYLSGILIEPSLVFMATALHLFFMLWLGWNPVIGAQEFLYNLTSWSPLDTRTASGNLIVVAGQTVYFLFFGIVCSLILRCIHRRPLWDRFFVARTLVIGDDAHVKELLAQYVSKLFSLAYEFSGFASIHGADASSGELLHGYGHRVTRGLILFLGVPDGRSTGRERAQSAACMTASQVRGVQNMESGPTVIGLGHGLASADQFDRFVNLDMSARATERQAWDLDGDGSQISRELKASRFDAFERLMAGYVIFHSAAARTRDFMNFIIPFANLFWSPIFLLVRVMTLGKICPCFRFWDLARTQSGTRIATTASPVAAITLDPRHYLTPSQRRAEEEQALDRLPDAAEAAPEVVSDAVVFGNPGIHQHSVSPIRRRGGIPVHLVSENNLVNDVH